MQGQWFARPATEIVFHMGLYRLYLLLYYYCIVLFISCHQLQIFSSLLIYMSIKKILPPNVPYPGVIQINATPGFHIVSQLFQWSYFLIIIL